MAADSTPTPYPKRPRFFSHRFTRLMAKVCLANEIGPEACWMLTVIAHTEDAAGYRKPVSFFNHQLAPLVGAGSVDALDRIRKKAVGSGWLNYEPGKKGIAGRYFVVIPDSADGIDDLPSDEQPDEYLSAESRKQPRGKPEESAEATARKAGGKPEESAEQSSLSLSLSLPPEAGEGSQNGKPQDEIGWLVRVWLHHKAHPNKPGLHEELAAIFGELLRHGHAAAALADAITDPARVRTEWPSDFAKRLTKGGRPAKPPETPTERDARIVKKRQEQAALDARLEGEREQARQVLIQARTKK